MRILLISASLSPTSRSRRLAAAAREHLLAAHAAVDYVDLRELELPICGTAGSWDHHLRPGAVAAVEAADAILVATPIYNYDVNAALKNFVELTGRAWTEKLVGFLCAAGGHGSYMAVMAFASSLMLDFRCLILPRYVYAVKSDFTADGIGSEEVAGRIEALCADALRIGAALRSG